MKKAVLLTGCLLAAVGCANDDELNNAGAEEQDVLEETNEQEAEEEPEDEENTDQVNEDEADSVTNETDAADSDFMSDAEAAYESLESYTSETALDIIVNQDGATVDQDTLLMYNTIVREDPPHILVEVEDMGVRYYHSYTVDNKVYFHDGASWMEDLSGYGPDELSYTEYDNLWEILERNERLFTVSPSEETVEISYFGQDSQIYNAFRSLFELDFYGVDTASVENDVRYLFNEEALLEEVFYEAKAANHSTNEEVILRIHIRYDDLNDAGDLGTPEGMDDLL
ncbi:hypothetical protein [Alkalicoccus luteus]|uniref:hypothetical protein n=1 Tax=Alkalicoccus luteus TaxID=1237094 RepID=UPI0040341C28